MKNIISYLALGLSVIALFLGLHSSGLSLGAAPSVNCNGRSYCTAWQDVLFRNASSSAGKIDAVNLTISGTTTLSSTGNCATASFAPGTLTSITSASTSLAVTNAAPGDLVLTSFDSVTSTNIWFVDGNVSAAGTIKINFGVNSSSSVALTTSTIRACVIK